MKSVLNHIAILVESIEQGLKESAFNEDVTGKIKDFPSEGTREVYIGKDNQMGRLLLMQAIGDGPYKDALCKRGVGLHHIALDVENIEKFVDQLSGSGWLLHPQSLNFYKNNRQVYLCRPGTPVLIEVQEREALDESSFFIDQVELSFKNTKMLQSLNCSQLSIGDSFKLFKNGDPICQSFM